LPGNWLVAGSIAQTVWNLALGRPAGFGIKDADVVYFDAQDLSFEAEVENEQRLRDLFRHLPVKLDVKNEARVHLWYERSFGYPIAPYLSAPAAIATFPTTATAIGVRCKAGKFECYSPFGLDDLFDLVCSAQQKADHAKDLRGKSRSLAIDLASVNCHPMDRRASSVILLLADAEIAENHVEQIFDIDGSGDAAEAAQSQAEIFGTQLG
jgi:uncharacterized protein